MSKLSEAELFINKLNACNEPVLTKEGTKHAIEIIANQLQEIERLKEDYAKEKYLVDKYTRQLTDEYKNTEYQCKEKERLNNIIEKAIDYIKKEITCYSDLEIDDLIDILQGSDKE